MGEEKTTWDGAPVSQEKPYGTTILVYRWKQGQVEFLVLHRVYNGLEYDGDWAWTPPSGARFPGENVDVCARRELGEETGLALDMEKTDFGTEDWLVYLAEAPPEAGITLSPEHDRWTWCPAEEAQRICRPAAVGEPIRLAGEYLALNG